MSPQATSLVQGLIREIANPLILLLIAVAVVYFLWGLATFLANAEDSAERALGKSKIVWGLVGLLIMVSVFGILQVLLGTFGIPAPTNIQGA